MAPAMETLLLVIFEVLYGTTKSCRYSFKRVSPTEFVNSNRLVQMKFSTVDELEECPHVFHSLLLMTCAALMLVKLMIVKILPSYIVC